MALGCRGKDFFSPGQKKFCPTRRPRNDCGRGGCEAQSGACLVKLAPAVWAHWPEVTDGQRHENLSSQGGKKILIEYSVPARGLCLASRSSHNSRKQVSFFPFHRGGAQIQGLSDLCTVTQLGGGRTGFRVRLSDSRECTHFPSTRDLRGTEERALRRGGDLALGAPGGPASRHAPHPRGCSGGAHCQGGSLVLLRRENELRGS